MLFFFSDPAALLSQALTDQSQTAANAELQLENERLQSTIKEYHAEFAEIKNQEVTIKRLQDKLDEYEKKTEETVQHRVREKERQLQRQFAEKEREVGEQQLKVATSLGEAEAQVGTMRDALDATQSELFDLRSKYDEDMAARAAELEIVSGDFERVSVQAEVAAKELAAERERFVNHQQQEAGVGVGEAIDAQQIASLERELSGKEHEISELIDNQRELQESLGQLKLRFDDQAASYEAALAAKTEEAEAVRSTLAEQADYTDLQGELAVLKAGEFGESLTVNGNQTLEALLSQKNRALKEEKQQLMTQVASLTAKLERVSSAQSQSSTIVNEQVLLIEKLEADLTAVNSSGSRPSGAREGPDAKTLLGAKAAVDRPGIVGIDESVGVGSAQGDEALMGIVASQRDRFRARNAELEGENRHATTQLVSLRGEVDTLRADNVKLYEKIKFMQQYGGSTSTRSAEAAVDKYGKEYEEHINPFKAFSSSEKQRRLMNMSPADRIAHSISRVVLQNARARLVFVGYILFIHGLIFVVLMRYSHTAAGHQNLALECMHLSNHIQSSLLHDTEALEGTEFMNPIK